MSQRILLQPSQPAKGQNPLKERVFGFRARMRARLVKISKKKRRLTLYQ